jgi:phytoene dehydrogenase-like protein
MFISCTTLKDPPSFDGRHHTLEVVTFINRESFNHLKEDGYHRSKEYAQFKERLTQKMINGLERVLPGVSNKIVHKELGTPITNEFYINSTEGSVYGTEKSFKQTGPFSYKAKTEIENLYLCGASVMAHGVAGASYSGVQTAAIILNCKQEDLIKTDESQNMRIYNAENSSEYPEWMLRKMKMKKSRARAALS